MAGGAWNPGDVSVCARVICGQHGRVIVSLCECSCVQDLGGHTQRNGPIFIILGSLPRWSRGMGPEGKNKDGNFAPSGKGDTKSQVWDKDEKGSEARLGQGK